MLTEEQRERQRAYQKAYYERHKTECKARSIAQARANPDAVREYRRRSYLKHRAARLEVSKAFTRKKRGIPEPTRPKPAACECCKKTDIRRFTIDHCHATGAFRGWICDSCNLGLGKLGDDEASLLRALEYLRRANVERNHNSGE